MKKPGTFGSTVPKGDFSRLSGDRLKDAKKSAFLTNWPKSAVSTGKRPPARSTKKVQEGELGDDYSIRRFDEHEKWKTERDSFLYKIFGKDFYLDGFTAKTMKRDDQGKNDVMETKK
ncbi:hypothetical protein OXX69_003964 [Metschnikowia pulcherrima]